MGKETIEQNGVFGQRIRELRGNRSIKDFSGFLCISSGTLRGIEQGEKPNNCTFELVLSSLRVEISREEASKFASDFGYKELADIYAASLASNPLDSVSY